MDRLLRLGAGGMGGLGGSAPPSDAPAVDTAEQVYISSLALLKVSGKCSLTPIPITFSKHLEKCLRH